MTTEPTPTPEVTVDWQRTAEMLGVELGQARAEVAAWRSLVARYSQRLAAIETPDEEPVDATKGIVP